MLPPAAKANQACEKIKNGGGLIDMFVNGMRTKSIYWSDGTSAGGYTCARFYSQNDRKYSCRSAKKDSVLEELVKPVKVRTPGIMEHIAANADDGGVLLKPHFAPAGQTMPANYYAAMLAAGPSQFPRG